MSEAPASTTGSARTRRSETTTYVVMWKREVDGKVAWMDVAEVTVPSGTKRRTVIEKAVETAELDLVDRAATDLRVLTAEDATPIKVRLEQPAPQLRIG